MYGPKHPLAGQKHRSGGRSGDRKGRVFKIDGAAPPPTGETRFYLVERVDRNTILLHVCDGLPHNYVFFLIGSMHLFIFHIFSRVSRVFNFSLVLILLTLGSCAFISLLLQRVC